MFYSIENTQAYFEFWVLIVLLLNLMIFITITFRPTAVRNIGNWATGFIERMWKQLFSKKQV